MPTTKEKRREYFRKWYIAHKEKYRTSKLKFLEKNPGYHRLWREEHPEYYQTWRSSNIAKRQAWYRAWNAKNLDKIRIRQRIWNTTNYKKCLLSCRKWKSAHPEASSRRRALRRNAAGCNYTTLQHIKWRWEMWGDGCYVCGGKASVTDHVIPLSRGGSHWPSNLRPICQHCNSRKNAKPLNEFKKYISLNP